MKIKNILSVIAFTAFFSISLIFGTLYTSSAFAGFFHQEIDSQKQAKIFNFLQKDLNIQHEMAERLDNIELSKKVLIIKDYYEMREKLDTSDLPEDFRYAWEKKILSDVEWVGFMYHLRVFNHQGTIETKAEKELANEKVAESQSLDNKLAAVAKRYGIKFDANNFLIEKK